MHRTYHAMLDALHMALAGAGLSQVVEIDGPNRLGGFRLTDGTHRIALSHIPSRKDGDDRVWWVSAWLASDSERDTPLLPDPIPAGRQQEIILRRPMDQSEAIIAAVQMLVEQRIRSEWQRVAAERDAALAEIMAAAIHGGAVAHHTPVSGQHEISLPPLPARDPEFAMHTPVHPESLSYLARDGGAPVTADGEAVAPVRLS